MTGPGEAGMIQRVNWDLRHNVLTATGLTMPTIAAEGAAGRAGRGGGRGGRGGGGGGGGGGDEGGIAGGRGDPYPYAVPRTLGARGAFVSPGTYTVTLQAGDARATETVRVLADPLLQITLAQHKEREGFQLEMTDMLGEIITMSQQLANARRDLTARRDGAAAGSASRTEADSSLARLTNVERSFVMTLGRGAGPDHAAVRKLQRQWRTAGLALPTHRADEGPGAGNPGSHRPRKARYGCRFTPMNGRFVTSQNDLTGGRRATDAPACQCLCDSGCRTYVGASHRWQHLNPLEDRR